METPIYNSIEDFIYNLEKTNSTIGFKKLKIILPFQSYNELLKEINTKINHKLSEINIINIGNYEIVFSYPEREERIINNELNKLHMNLTNNK